MSSPRRQTQPESRRQFSEYYKPRPTQQTSPKKPKRTFSLHLPKRTVLLAMVVAFVALTLPFTQLDPARAKVQVNNAGVYHAAATYEAAVKAQLSKALNRSFFTLDERSVSDEVRKQFPEISQLTIAAKPFSRAVNVKITTKTPAFVLSSASDSYVVDSEGLAISKYTNQATTGSLVRIEDKTGFELKAGRQVFSSEDMQFITQLVEGMRSSGTAIGRLELPAIAKQLRLYQPGTNYYVKFYTGGNAAIQLGSLAAIGKQLMLEGKQPTQYIDVRVEGKVFYK